MAIDTGWNTKYISFKERLLAWENIEGKVTQLNKHVDAFKDNSTEFFNLFNNIVLNEELKGEMIEEMEEAANDIQREFEMYHEELANKNKTVVERLEAQIEENKTQTTSATYYVSKDS